MIDYLTTGADTVRRYYDLVDAGETDALVGLFAEDAVYLRPGYEPLVGQMHCSGSTVANA